VLISQTQKRQKIAAFAVLNPAVSYEIQGLALFCEIFRRKLGKQKSAAIMQKDSAKQ
jgi:hypothetical protein